MEQVRAEAFSPKRGAPGRLANKQAADHRANALAATLHELRAAGFVGRQAMADELNRRSIPTTRGGKWHYTTVVRMLTRLGLLTPGKGARINSGQEGKRAADARALALASTIRELQANGLVTLRAIAHALNEREIPTVLGSRWHPGSVYRLLERQRNLDRARLADTAAKAVFLPVESI